MKRGPGTQEECCHAFTLVELLVSLAVIILLVSVLISVTSQAGSVWRYTTAKTEEFREARGAFETMTTRLSQATLNTYWDYDNAAAPKRYERRSELRFTTGPGASLLGQSGSSTRLMHAIFFHAPLGFTSTAPTSVNPGYRGLDHLLNVWGYYLELSPEPQRPPFITTRLVPDRYRFRLQEYMQPSENLATYNYTSGGTAASPLATAYQGNAWFTDGLKNDPPPVHQLAENIVALIVTPRLAKQDELLLAAATSSPVDFSPVAPSYSYDTTKSNPDPRLNSKNQLPPVVQITLVAIDELSAARLKLGPTSANVLGLASKFTDTNKYSQDLTLKTGPGSTPDDSLENKLVALKANYRVFSSNVQIRAAKWSREQKN